MPKYRATVDYGDDRIRTYSVWADSIDIAERETLAYVTEKMLTVAVLDDHDEWDEDDFDGELDFAWIRD